ncbi:MAG: hypothetical protein NZM06_07670 [Chloroherpetonaceae bacterium]|nr:hypothetical protein [Chloroherpetonaceae bacterium]MDW8437543.1 hypothetical protein [Chloroherpetonaceae bacterium]
MGTGLYVILYWGIGVLCAILFLGDELFPQKKTERDWKRSALIFVSFLLVLFNAYIYKNSTETMGRPLDYLSMFVFGLGNGVCETFIFIVCFKLGESMMARYTDKKPFLFLGGLLIFMAFSGFIHSAFWMNEFPPHLTSNPEKMVYKAFFMPLQFALAISWALIYFLYRDIWSIAFLHVIVDVSVIYSIHYSLFSRNVIVAGL